VNRRFKHSMPVNAGAKVWRKQIMADQMLKALGELSLPRAKDAGQWTEHSNRCLGNKKSVPSPWSRSGTPKYNIHIKSSICLLQPLAGRLGQISQIDVAVAVQIFDLSGNLRGGLCGVAPGAHVAMRSPLHVDPGQVVT
jgi:hypothetical protein